MVSLLALGKRLAEASDTAALVVGADGLKRDLVPAASHSADLISSGWRARTDQAFSSIGQLGGILRQIPETEQLGIEMEALVHRVEQLRDTRKDAAHCAERLTALQVERDDAIGKLTRLGAGEAVVDFLIAVAGRSATLENVTPEVRNWLDTRNVLDRFNVSL